MSKWILTTPLILNGQNDGRFCEKMEESPEVTFVNLKENLWARLSNASKNLENGDVGLKFRLKMLEFMDTMN